MGQRVFKSEPQTEQLTPNEKTLGRDFTTWLKNNFGWLFGKGNAKSMLGMADMYGDGAIPSWALLGEYDNGSSTGKGNAEYIWLPTEDGGAIPVGFYKGGTLYAVHADHLGTPRLITDNANKPIWQWPYSGFGNNKPSGVLSSVSTTRLKATTPTIEFNLRFPGQYFDSESNLAYNGARFYDSRVRAGYVQPDPIGLSGGRNRFGYAENSSLTLTDPLGLDPYTGQTPPAKIPGGPWEAAGSGQKPGTFFGPKQPNGPRTECRFVPDGKSGGPSGANESYWKVKEPGKGWARYNSSGTPITPEEAHPGNSSPRAVPPATFIPRTFPIPLLVCPLCNVLMPTTAEPS